MLRPQTSSTFIEAVRPVTRGIALFFSALVGLFVIAGGLTSVSASYQWTSDWVSNATRQFDGSDWYQLFVAENRYFAASLPADAERLEQTDLFFQLSNNISLDDPRSFLGRELPGFALYDSRILAAADDVDYTNLPKENPPREEALDVNREPTIINYKESLDETPDTPVNPEQTTGEKDVVYVYFTHSRESYLPYLEGVTDPNLAQHSELNVTKIGDSLKESLERRGIGTDVDKTDIVGLGVQQGQEYYEAYDTARPVVANALENNRDLQYAIDIHRDSYRREETTKEFNGVPYARLAFVVGGENENYEQNMKLANELHARLNEKYPGISRAVVEKSGTNVDGTYNQDLTSNSLLVEFGGVDNTFEELNRTAEVFAEVFSEYYWQAEEVSGSPSP
ncbi:stage II sporulation protein P [Bacillus fonticola]|uniref:stage II sporulation protein P n=1 Tax=Bacillus fonticola TaxID=2728853 RepID=UPI001475A546|nr:stage II sporulation protein P [Bacillus fonticola]